MGLVIINANTSHRHLAWNLTLVAGDWVAAREGVTRYQKLKVRKEIKRNSTESWEEWEKFDYSVFFFFKWCRSPSFSFHVTGERKKIFRSWDLFNFIFIFHNIRKNKEIIQIRTANKIIEKNNVCMLLFDVICYSFLVISLDHELAAGYLMWTRRRKDDTIYHY